MSNASNATRLRGIAVIGCGLIIAASLSGCGLFGGKTPPAKTYIVVPQQGTLGNQTPPANP